MSRPNDLALAINQGASEPHDMEANFDILDRYLLGRELPDRLEEAPENYARLQAYMAQLSVPHPEAAPAHGNLAGWEGVYTQKEGGIHPQPELRPFGNVNVNQDFYTLQDVDVHRLEIRRCEEGLP